MSLNVSSAAPGVVESVGAGLLLAALTVLPGLPWAGLASREPGPRAALARLGLAIAISVSLLLVAATALAEIGRLSLPALLGGAAALGAPGAVLLHRARGGRRADLLAAAAVAAALCAVLLLPRRGEWIVGGWDPGVYMNQGLEAARTGSFHAPPDAAWRDLAPAGFAALTREIVPGFHEAWPGVPVDTAARTREPYFFRAHAAWIAVLAEAGGLPAAVRVNLVAGLLALLVLAGLLAAARLAWTWIALAPLILALHPLWLYQTRTPTSETLTALLALALGAAGFHRAARAAAPWTGLVLAAAVLARFEFAAFGGLWMVFLAWADRARDDRGRVRLERAAQAAGLCAGIAANHLLTPLTYFRLGTVCPLAEIAGLSLAMAALVMDRLPAVRRLAIHPAALFAVGGVGAVFVAAAVTGILSWKDVDIMPILRAQGRYLGWPLLIPAAAGLLVFVLHRRIPELLVLFVLFLGLCGTAALADQRIVPIFPWAARRLAATVLPALAILAAVVPAALAVARIRPVWRILAAAAALPIVLLPAPRAAEAWRHTEYDGLAPALADAAARLPADAVVVADHHWWGTPLAFLHGREVVNGAQIWQARSETERRAAAAAIVHLAARGRRVAFLTSTAGGMDLYPAELRGAAPRWQGAPLALREMRHGEKVRGFPARERTVIFGVYELPPTREPRANSP